MSILYRLRCLHRPLQTFGLAAAMAGNAKKIVASKLQKIPIAHAMPSPLREGLRAQPNEPNPLTAVRPARITGLMTPATSSHQAGYSRRPDGGQRIWFVRLGA